MALVTQFLTQIAHFVTEQDGDKLGSWLQVEPNSAQQYYQLGEELRSGYSDDEALSRLVEQCLPEKDDVPEGQGTPWPGFVSFMKEYLQYWRDVNFDDLVPLHGMLSSLLTSCAIALSNPTYGKVLFRTSISISSSLSKLAMILNRRPDLTSKIRRLPGEERKTIVEQTAETIQKIFTTCLTDRSSGRYNKPEGKKAGVYICCNLVLKLIFTCHRSHLAIQMLTNIAASGPALSLFPLSQQVTYLYYLGRFHFENCDWQSASGALERAYLLTPFRCQTHRRLILTYLLPAMVIQGRFPKPALFDRPEAALTPLKDLYTRLAFAAKTGNFPVYDAAIRDHKAFLWKYRQYVTLQARLKPLIWRSLLRRTFLLTYEPPPPTSSDPISSQDSGAAAKRPAPTLDLEHVVTVATFTQHRLEGYLLASELPVKRAPHTNALFRKAVSSSSAGAATTLVPPPGGPKVLMMTEGLVGGNREFTIESAASQVGGLIAQGFIRGFISHTAQKCAITGAGKGSAREAVEAGWPGYYAAIKERYEEEEVDIRDIPGWVVVPGKG